MRRFRLSPAIAVCLLLALAGCLAIYNATSHLAHPYYFVYRQLIWLVIGTGALIGCSRVRAGTWCELAWPLAAMAWGLLYTLLMWGATIRGMRGWFRLELPFLEPVFSPILIQPSELAKPLFVVFLAAIARDPIREDRPGWKQFALWLALASIWLIPIALQPDFGTLAVFVATLLVIYWLQGGRFTHLAVSILAAGVVFVLALLLHPYARRRLAGFLDPAGHASGSGWHIIQFQVTLAHGGVTGTSQPLWSQHYLPLGYSDSIVATVAERVGLLGIVPLLLLVLAWLAYGLYLARHQADYRASLIVAGITVMLTVQALLHVSVTLGLLPPTGITFPLLSYGGSSLCATMIAIGILLGASRDDTSTARL